LHFNAEISTPAVRAGQRGGGAQDVSETLCTA
jgi:hypothetical protein